MRTREQRRSLAAAEPVHETLIATLWPHSLRAPPHSSQELSSLFRPKLRPFAVQAPPPAHCTGTWQRPLRNAVPGTSYWTAVLARYAGVRGNLERLERW